MEEPTTEMELAIRAGAKAGVFWRAARLNPKQAATWNRLGEAHHRDAALILNTMLNRLGADNAGPCSFEEG